VAGIAEGDADLHHRREQVHGLRGVRGGVPTAACVRRNANVTGFEICRRTPAPGGGERTPFAPSSCHPTSALNSLSEGVLVHVADVARS